MYDWMDGWLVGWMVEWLDGWMVECTVWDSGIIVHTFLLSGRTGEQVQYCHAYSHTVFHLLQDQRMT
jgi:hypothetical protein